MTLRALTLQSERWLDEAVFTTSWTNVGADVNDTFSLPSGSGEVAIMEIMVLVIDIATAVAPENLGIQALIQSAASGAVDFAGMARFSKISATRVGAYISPDPLVIWKENELLQLQYPELDSNASPTDDHVVYVKTVRVRPQEDRGVRRPIQLVR